MKTLKIYLVSALLLFIGFGNCYGQASNKNKVVLTGTYCAEHWGAEIPGFYEPLYGCVDYTMILWGNGKVQIRFEDVIMYGEETGDPYIVRQILNQNFTSDNPTQPHTLLIYHEGKLVLLAHAIYHYTIDAEGVWHLEFVWGFDKVK